MSAHLLVQRIQNRQARIGVIGLGYVGLPLVLAFIRRGFAVTGFDRDLDKVAALQNGRSYIHHIAHSAIAECVGARQLTPTADFAMLSQCHAILICVPTPLTPQREPDMQFILSTANTIAPYLVAGQLIVLESTTYPGTTDEVLRTALEAGSTLKAGQDFFLAYSPEREDPGNPNHTTQSIPKIVGGFTPACMEAAVALYQSVLNRVIPVSSTQAAEMTKLLENIFRAVNIALVNELKVLCDRMHIDIWEIIDAAATKPFGYMPFSPGPGLGGHCIPIDPFYLTWKAREFGLNTRFIELAGEINSSMPEYVIRRTTDVLNDRRKPINGSQILILGAAYKQDVDDVRESPALTLISLLQERGAVVSYHDPYVPSLPKMRRHDLDLQSAPLTPQTLPLYDAVLIVTAHTCIDYSMVVEHAQLVIDTRNATKGVGMHRDRIVKA